ncbi:phenylacetate--CoA ligase [Taibaiella lutea]|uniref:Phenylacetate-coenzyme A ligase n=1 Tax=Taibaiella lutea TaxID=2608001 RepID=A0A5M6CP00_9BACT|nr:phenylacetate--CoA ligase [Taibaiella lutea]KAA5534879.1 phenylacetate--CoA ligase [Taibaiella lutea]
MSLFNKEIETMPLDKLRSLQNKNLKDKVEQLYAKVPFYKQLFDSNGIAPKDIQTVHDLYKIPFTKKNALRDNYPFGLFTVPKNEVARLHCSSGTTGKPIVVGYTWHDLEIFSEVVARSLAAAGCKPSMLLQNAYGYGLFTGGLGLHYGAEKLGMTVLPISGGGTEKQLMLMRDFESDAICCTPSYALTLAEEIRKQGIDPSSIKLKYAILGAEPWTEGIRTDVEKGLRLSASNIYGLSEIMGPGVSSEDFEEKGTGSYIWEDHFYPEIVDKDTGEPLPYGSQGVLTFTTLTKEAMPLLRFWTNDITSLSYEKSNKRTHIKMAPIAGRADDMLIIRGVNLFHTQVEAILEFIPELSLNYQLIVSRTGTMDEVEVCAEVDRNLHEAIQKEQDVPLQNDRFQKALQLLKKKIKDDIGLSMKITLMMPESIPRSDGGKLNRIIDKRKG